MSAKSTTKTEPKIEAPEAVEIVVQISDLVLQERGSKDVPTLTAIARTTSRAAGLLHFETREEKIAAENAAAMTIAKRSNLI
jgi:hypothetical protein